MTEQATGATLAERLKARFGDTLLSLVTEHGETTIELAPDDLLQVARALRDESEFRFGSIVDVCGVDYLGYGQVEWDTTNVTGSGFSRGVQGEAAGRFAWEDRPVDGELPATDQFAPHARSPANGPEAGKRFASVIHLLSHEHNRRVRIRVFGPDNNLPVVPSVTSLWSGANWFERESFDLFGIVYEGHPDLRRILTDYGFVGRPFRKDFPLIGNVEVRYDTEAGRVVYEKVSSVEPRVTVPRVIRDDSGLLQGHAEAADDWRKN